MHELIYGPDTDMFSLKPVQTVLARSVTVSLKLATKFLKTTHCLIMMIIDAKKKLNSTIRGKGPDMILVTYNYTHAQTDIVNSISPPTISRREHKKVHCSRLCVGGDALTSCILCE